MGVQKRNGKNRARILIVDDEFHVARSAAMVLSQAGYDCETCPNVEAALKLLENQGADVIIADMRMPGMDGMDLLKKVHTKDPDMAVVMSVPLPAAESAKAALRGGAFDCVTKPFDDDELNAVVTRAVEMSVYVVRAFVKLREVLSSNRELARRFEQLESRLDSKLTEHDEAIAAILSAIRELMRPRDPPRRGIGFTAKL